MRRYRAEHLAIGFTLLFNVTVLLDLTVVPLPIVRPVVGFVFLTFVTGGIALTAVGETPAVRARWVSYAVGVSLIIVMLTGLVVNILFLRVGLNSPLSAVPSVIALSLFTVGVSTVSLWRHTNQEFFINLPEGNTALSRMRRNGLQASTILLIPIASILAVTHLNRSNDPVPLLFILIVIATLPIVTTVGLIDKKYFPLTVGASGLAILYHKSLWVGSTYGGHLAVVSVYEQEIWNLTGETLLPNTVLMPLYAHITGIGILTQVSVIMSVMVVFIPIALYVTFQSYVSSTAAYLGAALFMFAHPFYLQYPSSPRASIPVLFLALIGTAMSDGETDLIIRRGLAGLFAIGLAVSHYGTSYYVLFALIGAIVLLFQFHIVDRVVAWIETRRLTADGGQTYEKILDLPFSDVITSSYVIFYAVVVTAWYHYIDQGSKFEGIVQNVAKSFTDLFASSGGGTGSTAVRLATDYGGQSIRYSKYLYVMIAGLIALGLMTAFARRWVPWWQTDFSDEYLSVAALLFVLFTGTFIISGQWGGGRPLMIVLSFNAIFAVRSMIGFSSWLTTRFVAPARFLSDRIGKALTRSPAPLAGKAAFATILAVFFVVNTGFMSAIAYGGVAPSNVANTDTDDIYKTYDINTHAWLADHRDDTYEVYADRRARVQTNDWMNGEIAAKAETNPYRISGQNTFTAIDNPTLERGYVLFISHNINQNLVEVNYITSRPLDNYNLQRDRRHVIYSNGAGRVYFAGNSTQKS